jgi:SNF2 family DNA or RNA helicase
MKNRSSRFSVITAVFDRFNNKIQTLLELNSKESSIYSYDPFLSKPLLHEIELLKAKSQVTEDFADIPYPTILNYSKPSIFKINKIYASVETKMEKASETLSHFQFNPLLSPIIEGCDCNNLQLYTNEKKIEKPSDKRDKELDLLHLAISNLYPTSMFDFSKLTSFPVGKQLFPFQSDGVSFLIRHENALLADEMGLGKSIQAIIATRLLLKSKIIENSLIVCPKSVLVDWETKFEEWAPELSLTMISGPVNKRRELWNNEDQIFLVTYDTLREDALSDGEKQTMPSNFDLIILDEVQRIKNSSTKIFNAINLINGQRRWGLSGTPLENRVEELSTIFSYIKPGLFVKTEVNNPLLVKAAIEPFVLRRVKQAVLQNLPEKIHDEVLLDLEPKQRAAYHLAEKEGIIMIKEKGKLATVTHVLALISKLKQICNLEPESGESCKLNYLIEMLENLSETDEKMLVFSQYPEKTLRLIEPKLRRFNPLMYHGSLSSKERESIIERFNEDEEIKLLLMSVKAGGLGLTLTRANYVVHFDSWWNPAIMSQAEDRTHRIGQVNNVFVSSLITKNTIERRIQMILEEKRGLFKDVMGDISDAGLTQMLNEREIFGLFGLDRSKN